MDNQFYRFFILIAKTFTGLVLLLLTMRLFSVTDAGAVYFGWLLLVFFTLPTVFIVFFKNITLKKYPGFAKYWKVLKMIYIIIVILFVMLLIMAIVRYYQKSETAKAVEFINSQKITLDDVMGKNLPPAPDQAINDSTIAGIDANKNGIRDDVELAIFKKYPDSARIRAAELQFVQKVQLQLTKVYNTETMVAAKDEVDTAYQCLVYAMSGDFYTPESKPKDVSQSIKITGFEDVDLSGLILNTKLRNQEYYTDLNKYLISYSFVNSRANNLCDINISSLPN